MGSSDQTNHRVSGQPRHAAVTAPNQAGEKPGTHIFLFSHSSLFYFALRLWLSVWGPLMSARLGWAIQESPSILLMLLYWFKWGATTRAHKHAQGRMSRSNMQRPCRCRV